jgi:hypothetical protein
MTLRTFHADSFFLVEHKVFEELAQQLTADDQPAHLKRWLIVCERKEDLIAVRTQIFSLLSKQDAIQKSTYSKHGQEPLPLTTWAGLSLYTPDTLVRNFCLTLSHNALSQLGPEIHQRFRQPFLDVVEQEKLMRLLLLRLGYAQSDVAPLAKQILTLADTPLPADESFLNLLFEVQSVTPSSGSIRDIPDSSLRTICVAFQLAQKILSSFCRLQSFVSDYWVPSFPDHLRACLNGEAEFRHFLLPTKFLNHSLLWIAAPEYGHSADSLRPGNFQASVIDSLRDGLFAARQTWAEHHRHTPQTWWSRTIIPTATITPKEPHARIFALGSYAALAHHFSKAWKDSKPSTQFLLGDLNSRIMNVVRSDGSGIHALTPHDFEKEVDGSADTWASPASDRVDGLRTEFESFWKRLSVFDNVIHNALAQYDLSRSVRDHGVGYELMLHRFFDSETFSFSVTDDISQLPPALSFIAGLSDIYSFCIVGIPHSPTTPSFHLRLLNAVFHLLRSKQVALEPIASEESYRGYWQSILSRRLETTFLIKNLNELKDFPDNARQWCLPPVQLQTLADNQLRKSAFERWLGDQRRLNDEQWTRLLSPQKKEVTHHTLAVTAFEDYVECPLQFYWVKLHGLASAHEPALQPDARLTGQRAHAMAEKLIRGLRHLTVLDPAVHTRPVNAWTQFFFNLRDGFVDSDIFLSPSADDWIKGFRAALEPTELNEQQRVHVEALLQELAELLFSVGENAQERSLTPLKRKLVRETIRRAFKKLIDSELLETPSTAQVKAAFIEQAIQFKVHPQLLLTGRIDRIDTHPHGDRIIDYKTSKVGRKDPALVLDPREVKSTNRLSVQGGIYSLAWAQQLARQEDAQQAEGLRGVQDFALLRLKTMDLARDPYAVFKFDSPLKFQDDAYIHLAEEYKRRATVLLEGDFSPRPLTPTLCQWCPLENVCPAAGREAE